MTMRGQLLLMAAIILASACRYENKDELDAQLAPATPYTLAIPYYFPAMDVPADNPLTVEGIALGRRLYYDNLLSENGPFAGRSCSSCHHQASAFSLSGEGRSVLPHVNLAWSRNFLWTGKVSGTLEDVMRFEVEDFFQVDLNVLRSHPEYPDLFQRAFGRTDITTELVAKALAQWFRRMVSANSRFDGYLMHTEELSDAELGGMMIYLTETGDCFHCHGLPMMTDNGFHNIGLDSVFLGADQGRYEVTGDPADLGAFKAPALRNIALTAPYMHDGRFAALEQVVEHYNSGVKHSPSLDPLMTKPGQFTTLQLSPTQKADLVAFLHTLTDNAFLTNTSLASPF